MSSPPKITDPLSAFPEELGPVLQQSPIAYLPFGTVEWHGPHLPLGVDVYKVDAFVERSVAMTGGVVFPTITWNRNTIRAVDGVEHEGMEHVCRHLLPGNYHLLSEATFEALVGDMVTACFRRGFKVVCVWRGHNARVLVDSLPKLQRKLQAQFPERRLVVHSIDDLLLSHDEKATLGCLPDHAGKWETSVMLALRPDLVRLERLRGKDPVAVGATDNGVMHASADLGRRIFELCGSAMGGRLLRLLDEVPGEVPIPKAMAEAIDPA
ncbi:MAG: creatininase family protein [Planctomycetota bacterium]